MPDRPVSSAPAPLEIGTLSRLRITCISETGWRDQKVMLGDIASAGGTGADQYTVPWPPLGELSADNAGGSSALLEAEAEDGMLHRILFDSGWGPDWMERRFAEEGVDRLLRAGAIGTLVLSHEHFDHFWGIGAALKHAPALTVHVPDGFRPEGYELLRRLGHTGRVVTVPAGQTLLLFPGCALTQFPMSTVLQVRGENVLTFGIRGKGLAVVTGCGHPGILPILDHARRAFAGGDRVHAVYGGLHLAPFEEWNAEGDRVVGELATRGIDVFGCNHCTGAVGVERMRAAGLPVAGGTARNGSRTDLFLGNGDVLELVAGDAG